MARRIFGSLSPDLLYFNAQQVRHGHHIRGKPPTVALTLQQRLEKLNYEDPVLTTKIDIGLPVSKTCKPTLLRQFKKEINSLKYDLELEKKARKRQIKIDLEEIRKVWWVTCGPQHVYKIADHYGIYKDLYRDAFFYPAMELKVDYDLESKDLLARVYNGNVIKPNEAGNAPMVNYDADSDTLWTLLMTTPDGNLINSSNEYCHWFIGNIRGNDITSGEQLVDYLRPIPSRGIGYCRYIFVLYKQNKRIDYSTYKKEQPCLSLSERNWNTLDFYREHQDYLTPAGLTFFQSDWDQSLTDFYHHHLQMKEPVFQYDFPEPYVKPQTWFPLKYAFNLYLDRYRDPKQIQKEFLLRKLKKVHPFKEPEPPLKYPNAHAFEIPVPTWLRVEKRKSRLGWGRINNIEE